MRSGRGVHAGFMRRELENAMKSGVILGFVLALCTLGSPALAQRWGGGETLDRILPQIRAHHPGRLSDAEPFVGEDGDTHYRIKWMTPEGRIIYFDADGRSGRWTNSRGYEGGSRGYPGEDGPPRPYDRGGDDRWRGDGRQWNGQGRDWPGGGGRPYNDNGGDRPYPRNGGGRPYENGGDRPYNDNGGGRPYDGGGDRGWNGGRNWNGGSHHHGH